MPWLETRVEDQRLRFIAAQESGTWDFAELCREFGISRKTGYKWRERYAEGGPAALVDRSRRALTNPQAVSAETREQILALRDAEPSWGARKLQRRLHDLYPERSWPCVSTIGDLLAQLGLSQQSKRRRRRGPPSAPAGLTLPDQVNRVWCADFKGWWLCGDGTRCEPFTLMDGASRYLLRCQAVAHRDTMTLKRLFEAAFREYGLPEVIRTDNGAPFAAPGLTGLSELSVWWVRLGVRPERIAKGKPQQNGRLERLHRTLKAECATPPAATWRLQQRRLDQWRRSYNEERPHEALGLATPASCYERSVRRWPRVAPPFTYPAGVWPRLVNQRGDFRWDGGLIDVGGALAGQRIGWAPLEPSERYWRLFLGRLALNVFDSAYACWVDAKEAQQLVKRFAEVPSWHW